MLFILPVLELQFHEDFLVGLFWYWRNVVPTRQKRRKTWRYTCFFTTFFQMLRHFIELEKTAHNLGSPHHNQASFSSPQSSKTCEPSALAVDYLLPLQFPHYSVIIRNETRRLRPSSGQKTSSSPKTRVV